MAEDARKKKILDHLNSSSGGVKYTSPTAKRTTLPATSGVTPPPFEPETAFTSPSAPKVDNRKNRVMDHLNRSSDGFKSLAADSEKQKQQQIQNHLKKSQG